MSRDGGGAKSVGVVAVGEGDVREAAGYVRYLSKREKTILRNAKIEGRKCPN